MEKNAVEAKDSILKRIILGFFIGLAVIIPGVSGSTIAIIFKLYNKILFCVANFIKKFKYSILFLGPILLGAIIGIVFGFFTIQKLIDLIPFAIVALFAGLMVGALPSLKDEIRDVKTEKKHVLLLIIGILIPLTIAIVSMLVSTKLDAPENKLVLNFPSVCMYLLLGFLVAATQFIPGCSATATLMAFGYFIPIMNSLKLDYIKNRPEVLLLYMFLIIGFLLGCAVVSKFINHVIEKHKTLMYFVFIGLSIGSVLALFINTDMLVVYTDWFDGGSFPLLDLLLGIGLFVCGLAIAYQLVIYMRKKNKNNNINELD